MGQKTGIEWTDATWNPVRGCTRVSDGCVHCYAEQVAGRFSGPGLPYEGLATRKLRVVSDDDSYMEGRWTGVVRLVPNHLDDPVRWRAPRRIFVNSMSDLFHEKLSDTAILAVFASMAAAPHHQFQVLTKRAQRMRDWTRWVQGRLDRGERFIEMLREAWVIARGMVDPKCPVLRAIDETLPVKGNRNGAYAAYAPWPMPWVQLLVSVENQETADERIPLLLDTVAAVRGVSYEPALGPVDFEQSVHLPYRGGFGVRTDPKLDWVIVGGESARPWTAARPFDVQWAWDTLAWCRAHGAACFVKQLGSNPLDRFGFSARSLLKTEKGDSLDDFPMDLRVQEWPK